MRSVRQTHVVFWFCIACLVGLICGKYVSVAAILVLLLGFCSLLLWRIRSSMTIIIFIVFGLSLGVWRGHNISTELKAYEGLYGQEVVLEGRAINDGAYSEQSQLEFDIQDIRAIEPDRLAVRGTVQVRAFGVASIARGDNVRVSGKVFPAAGARQGRISFAEVEVLSRSDSVIESIRKKFAAKMYSVLPEPNASFGLGLLLGQRSSLDQNTEDTLRIVGLTHIVAVSGYNLTILVRLARRFGGKRSKYQSFLLATALIAVFLLFTGFSASIVRAAIVSGLSLAALYFGRTIKPLVLIAVAAAITALWNPVYVWEDIGWYLSFLAFFGVLILAPLMLIRIKKQKNMLWQVVAESFSAQILTLPLIVYLFNNVSVVGLLVNVLTVPFVPLAMLASLTVGVAGMVAPAISNIFALPANLILTYILDVARIFSRFSFASIDVSINGTGMLILYGAIAIVCAALHRYARRHHAKITDIQSV